MTKGPGAIVEAFVQKHQELDAQYIEVMAKFGIEAETARDMLGVVCEYRSVEPVWLAQLEEVSA